MRSDWENKVTADAWANAVAKGGDVFHQFILKPYIAAALSSCAAGKPEETSREFYEILGDAFEQSHDARTIRELVSAMEVSTAKKLRPLRRELRVLDLGGGEGFLGRWLRDHCSRYTVIDLSKRLIEHGVARAKKVHVNGEYLRGDLGALEQAVSFDAWLQACERRWVYDDLLPPPLSCDDYDVVLCCNVFDHIERPLVPFKRLSDALSNAAKPIPLILVTLNPDFFVGAEQWPQRSAYRDGTGEPKIVRMGPAAQDVEIVPRAWMPVEGLLNDAGFNVIAFDPIHISQYRARVQQELIERAGLPHFPAGGPFLMWHLDAGRQREVLDREEIQAAIPKFEILSRISKKQCELLLNSENGITRIRYAPGDLIAHPSNLPHGFFLVEAGEAEMLTRTERRQVFGQGVGFGELETGKDPFVSRFLYPVRAGKSGCTVIRLDKDLFANILELEDSRSLGDSLFELLRARVSTYSWVYHRSTYTTKNIRRIASEVTDRDCEALARILLFAATMEGGKLRRALLTATENNGLSVLVRLQAMREAIAGGLDQEPRANDEEGAKNTPYGETIRLFHAIAAVDVFEVLSTAGTATKIKKAATESFMRLLYVAIEHLLIRELAKSAVVKQRDVQELRGRLLQNQHTVPQWPIFEGNEPGWDVLLKQIVRNVSDTALSLTKDARNFADALAERIRVQLGPAVSVSTCRDAVFRMIYNLAFVRNEVFNRRQPRFIVINDMYFLRRVAVGAPHWREEIRSRAKASPYVELDGTEYKVFDKAPGEGETWRFNAYLRRFEAFVFNYWTKDFDLVNTHDAFFDEEGLVKRALSARDDYG